MISYIVKAVTIFRDGSKLPRYYEFRELDDAKSFIDNYFKETQIIVYTYDISLLKCQEEEWS